MSILDTLVTPLVAPLMTVVMMLPTGQSPVYATETHTSQASVQIKTDAEIMKDRRKALSSRRKQLIAKTGTANGNRAFAEFFIFHTYGWGKAQHRCLDKIWTQESHWNHKSMNKRSGAYGIPQALPGSKMKNIAKDWKTNPVTQIKWGTKYIKQRYGTPCKAWKFKLRNGWY